MKSTDFRWCSARKWYQPKKTQNEVVTSKIDRMPYLGHFFLFLVVFNANCHSFLVIRSRKWTVLCSYCNKTNWFWIPERKVLRQCTAHRWKKFRGHSKKHPKTASHRRSCCNHQAQSFVPNATRDFSNCQYLVWFCWSFELVVSSEKNLTSPFCLWNHKSCLQSRRALCHYSVCYQKCLMCFWFHRVLQATPPNTQTSGGASLAIWNWRNWRKNRNINIARDLDISPKVPFSAYARELFAHLISTESNYVAKPFARRFFFESKIPMNEWFIRAFELPSPFSIRYRSVRLGSSPFATK